MFGSCFLTSGNHFGYQLLLLRRDGSDMQLPPDSDFSALYTTTLNRATDQAAVFKVLEVGTKLSKTKLTNM